MGTGELVNPRPARNPSLLVLAGGLRAALFPIPVITLFWKDEIGMSLADIMLLQAIFGASVVLLEFPSGYIADRLGHRRSLFTGAVFWVVGWTAYSMGTTFGGMVVAEILLGVGLAFTSGADSALLFVSLQASDRVTQYPRWEGRVRAAQQTSEAISSGVGGWLYSITPRLPVWLQVPVALTGLGTITAMKEVPLPPPEERLAHLARAWHIVRHALMQEARLRSAMVLSVALGITTYVAVWLIQPWMQQRGIPAAWFGPLWAVAHLWLAAVSLGSARVGEAFEIGRTLFGCAVLGSISYFALAFVPSPYGVVFYLGFMTVRGLQGPLLASVLQADAPPEDRASVLSLNALLFRVASVAVLPPIGVLADLLGLASVLGLLGVLSIITALAAWRAFAYAHATSASG